MPTLRDTIAKLAEDFATQVLAAMRTASLEDVAALSGGRARAAEPARRRAGRPAAASAAGGRRRRSKEDIDALGQQIVDLLRSKPEGMRAEDIREALGVERKELPRALRAIVAEGSARTEGQKRATTYFAGEGGGAGGRRGTKKRAGKRGAKKGAGKRGGRRAKKAAQQAEA